MKEMEWAVELLNLTHFVFCSPAWNEIISNILVGFHCLLKPFLRLWICSFDKPLAHNPEDYLQKLKGYIDLEKQNNNKKKLLALSLYRNKKKRVSSSYQTKECAF